VNKRFSEQQSIGFLKEVEFVLAPRFRAKNVWRNLPNWYWFRISHLSAVSGLPGRAATANEHRAQAKKDRLGVPTFPLSTALAVCSTLTDQFSWRCW
jgi:hypothetical protein